MDKKQRTLIIVAAVCCLVVTAIGAFSFGRGDGVIIYREDEEIKAFDYSYQSEAGSYFEAHYDANDSDSEPEGDETVTAEYTVDINTATSYELSALLPGIGEKKAAAIIEHRELCGRYCSVDELLEVEGISRSLLERIRPYCTIGDSD